MYLICGLGNPGKKYSLTRHNLGSRVVDKLISNYNFEKFKFDDEKETYKGNIDNFGCYIIKPITYMNLSGVPIKSFSSFFKINLKHIIIIHDDIDIDLGKIKYKIGGGHGGHKGLVNIDQKIGNGYARLRIGVGHPGSKELVDSYVLKKFDKHQKIIIDKIISLISKNIYLILNEQKDLFLNKISTQMEISK